jgi:hypothetical protein
MSTKDFSWGKGGRWLRLTTHHPCSAERQENPGPYLPGTPWATSTCCGFDLYLYLYLTFLIRGNYCTFYGLLSNGISVALLRCPLMSGFVYDNDMKKAVEGSGVHF